jgi:hypothetical protein
MKKIVMALLAGVMCAGFINAQAAEKTKGGARGGRILEKTRPEAEFFVEKDRTASIKFYDAAGKAVSPAEQNVTVVADAKNGKQKVEFEKKGDALVSKAPLPEGEDYNLVVQFKQSSDAKPQNFRFKLNLHTCSECKRAEYACICDH